MKYCKQYMPKRCRVDTGYGAGLKFQVNIKDSRTTS